eukprot:TRINITY_DN63288_c0_g1_i1.p2 TRINITY_DN63288_c0_g1~~TRINITY_DN63288_c0_g1_i1.p2  ORF type:complete len:131 (+),score=28.00 TRINITY_DN63288_c0_g1_i1:21-413(+)
MHIRRIIMTQVSKYLFAAAALMGFAGAAHAEGEKVGDTQRCIRLQYINQTPVIDDKTILVEMKGGGFKRIDLLNKCSGLKIQGGFSHSTSTNDLCVTDPLRVLEPIGSTCLIDKIVTIDAAEAKELRKKK